MRQGCSEDLPVVELVQPPGKFHLVLGKILSLGVPQCFWVASMDWGVLNRWTMK